MVFFQIYRTAISYAKLQFRKQFQNGRPLSGELRAVTQELFPFHSVRSRNLDKFYEEIACFFGNDPQGEFFRIAPVSLRNKYISTLNHGCIRRSRPAIHPNLVGQPLTPEYRLC